MLEELHKQIEEMNFTDETSVKLTLRAICDFFAKAANIDPESPPTAMLDLWNRADSMNIFDHNQVKMFLKDIVEAINAFHPEGRDKVDAPEDTGADNN